MGIFEEFDKTMDMDKINKQKQEALDNTFPEVPKGIYIVAIESMELGQTKNDKRPMFKVQMRIVEGEGREEEKFVSDFKKKKPCIFMNRVIYGTKNDGAMIASVEGWLKKIFPDDPIIFTSYSQFAEEIMDAMEDIEGIELKVDYNPDAFNSVGILDVFDA